MAQINNTTMYDYFLSGNSKKSRSSQTSTISTNYMKDIMSRLKNQHHEESTRENYYGIWKNFNKFVIRLDEKPKTWEERLSYYVTYLVFECKVQSSTLKSYITAIKCILREDGYVWDEAKILLTSLTSLTKTCRKKNDTHKNKFPIQKGLLDLTLHELEEIHNKQIYLEILYKTIFSLMYYGLFRIGEVTKSKHVLKAKDVHSADNKEKMLFVLYSSKTHAKETFPQRVKITSNRQSLDTDKNRRKYCPFNLTREYLAIRGNYNEDEDQLFIFSDGSPVLAKNVRHILKTILTRLGLNYKNYSTHSFRVGRATDLMKNGISIEKIKQNGRWKSNTVYKYLKHC